MSASAPAISTDGRPMRTRFLGMQLVDEEPRHARAAHGRPQAARHRQSPARAKARRSTAGRSPTRPRSMRWRRIWKNPASAVARGSRALADERRVKDLIVFADPIGNRLEAFHGAEIATRAVQAGPLDLRFPHRSARHGPRGAHRRAARRRAAVLYGRPRFPARATTSCGRSRPISFMSIRATTASPSSIPARTASIT